MSMMAEYKAARTAVRPLRTGRQISFGVVGVMFVLAGVFWIWGARHLARDTELAPRRLENSTATEFDVAGAKPA